MKKILLAVVLLAFLAVGLVLLSFDKIVFEAVERGGTHALGVDTVLGSADIGLVSGEFELEALHIANPPGFSSEYFFELDQARVELEMGSLFQDTIRLPVIELTGIRLDLDKNSSGTNYGVLLDNLESLSSGDEPEASGGGEPDPPDEQDGGKSLAIERIVIRDVEARIKLIKIGGDASKVTVNIPEIVLNKPGEMTVSETYSLVIRALMSAVVKSGAGLLPEDILRDLNGRLGRLGGVAFQVTGNVIHRVDGVVTGVAGALGEAGAQVGEKAGEALKGVGEGLTKGLGKALGGGEED